METKPLPAHCMRYSFYFLQDHLGRELHYAYKARNHDHYKRVRKLKDDLERNPHEVIVKLCIKEREATRNPPGCQACAARLKQSRRSETIGLGQSASKGPARGGSEGTT